MKQRKPTLLTSEVLRLDTLQEPSREPLIDELMALDQKVFLDMAPEKTRAKFRGAHSDEVWILVIRDQEKLIGYNCIRISILGSRGRRFVLWNSRSAMDSSYRGLRKTGNFPLYFFFRFRMRYPLLPIRSLITLIHPSSYRLFSTRIPNLYPSARKELSPREAARYQVAFENLGLEQVKGKPAFVVKDSTITHTDLVEQDFWKRSPDPAVQFFHRHNPEYMQGQAITTYFKISFGSIVRMAYRQLKMGNPLRRAGLKLGLKTGWVSRKDLLRKVRLFANLPEQELQIVLRHVRSRWYRTGEVLVRQGESDRKMHIALSGALLVECETRVGYFKLAQLPVGEPAGEFAFLTGAPRMATVRSFRTSKVISLDMEDMAGEMEQMPELRARLEQIMSSRKAQNEAQNLNVVPPGDALKESQLVFV